MQGIKFIVIVFSVFFCGRAFAVNTPASGTLKPLLEDTSAKFAVSTVNPPAVAKRGGFFRKLKNKLVGFATQQFTGRKGETSTKTTLGLIAIGLVIAGVGLGIAAKSVGVFLGLEALALALGIGALATKNPNNKKGGNGAAIVAIVLLIGLVVALSTVKIGFH